MSKRQQPASFRKQMRQSMNDLRAIMTRGQSVSGDGRFTVRTIEVAEPGVHGAKSVRQIRGALNLSQALFAKLLGVSPALVRAWELGTREPAPIARRLLDRIDADASSFLPLLRSSSQAIPAARKRRVA